MSTLLQRILTGIVLGAVVIGVLFWLEPPAAAVFFSGCLLMGCWEWSGFLRTGRLLRVSYVAGGALLAWLLHQWLQSGLLHSTVFAIAAVWWLMVAAWLYGRDIHYGRWLTALAGYVCLLFAWVALLKLLTMTAGTWLLAYMIVLVVAADTGAYFAGKAFGQRKLAPLLSPGKTWEGLAGGLLAATAVAMAGAWMLELSPWRFAVLGPLIAAVSVVGDLTVSAFKRNAQLKDTGWILPGHGGVMDRIDSLVAAAPVFLLALSLQTGP